MRECVQYAPSDDMFTPGFAHIMRDVINGELSVALFPFDPINSLSITNYVETDVCYKFYYNFEIHFLSK